MLWLDIPLVIIALACAVATYRMLKGPTEADRAVAADLLLFGVVGLAAVFGIRVASDFTFDILLIISIVGFLGAVSLSRALTRGKR